MEIKSKYEELKKRVDLMIETKMIHQNTYIDFLLIALLGGVLIPPRRSLDYALMKVKNYDVKTDNYLKNGSMYFNQYKTAKTYGEQKLKLPTDLLEYIKKWIKFQCNDYLLFNNNKSHLTSSQITKRLNKIFGKKVSVDILRHVYLSNYYKDIPKLKDMLQLATDMSHSINTQLTQYVKKD